MKIIIFIKLFAVFLLKSQYVLAAGSGITYSGRLLDPSGNAVTGSNVQFRIQIRTPGNENCLMYEEIQNKDLTNSDGVFSITINDGSGSRTDSTGFGLDQLFANRGSFSFPAGYCVTGSVYNTTPTDGRKLQVYFNDGSFATGQWEPTPSMAINFIPMAIESQQVGGYKKEQLLKIADGVSSTGTELDSTKWANLLALINGTSTAFVKPSDQITQLYGATVPSPANGQSIRWNSALNAGAGGWENFTAGTASAVTTISSANGDITITNPSTTPQLTLNSGTAANQIVKLDGTAKLPAVDASALTNVNAGKVGGTAVSLASLTSGQVLKYNGSNWVNATLTDNDTLGGLSCASGRVAYYTGGSWACLEVTSSNTVNTIVSRDGSGVSAFGTVNAGTVKINDGGTGAISLITPAAVTSYTMRLPSSAGTAGQVLTTDGGSPAQLGWSTGSSQWATTGSDIYYNTGNVGVGLTSPTTKLDVAGNIKINNTLTTAGTELVFEETGDAFGTIRLRLRNRNGANGAVFENASLDLVDFGFIPSSGSSSQSNIRLEHRSGQMLNSANSSGEFEFINTGSGSSTPWFASGPAYTVVATGSVGFGVTNPQANFHVKRSGTGNNSLFESNCAGCNANVTIYNSAAVTGNSYSQLDFSVASASSVYGSVAGMATSSSDGALIFKTNLAGTLGERVRIINSGNLGIGTTNPTQKLQVGDSADGTVALANAWNTFSDKRLKKDFERIPAACEKLEKLSGYYYYWRSDKDPSRQIGVIAQEVEEVFPELVKTGESGIKSVDYSKFSAILIQANKELYQKTQVLEQEAQVQKTDIESLKLTNQQLQERLERLERKMTAFPEKN